MRPVVYILIFFVLLLIYILSVIFIIGYLKLPKNWPIHFILENNTEKPTSIDIYINNKFLRTIGIPVGTGQNVYIGKNVINNDKPLEKKDIQSISFFVGEEINVSFIPVNIKNNLYYVPEPDFKSDKNGELTSSFTKSGYYTMYF